MKNADKAKKSEKLTRFLRRISKGEDPRTLRKEASRLASQLDPTDLETAEGNLIKDGFSARDVQQLSSSFMLMGIIEEQAENLKTKLPDNHVLRLVVAEHDLLRCFIADLEEVTEEIDKLSKMTDVNAHFRKLTHIIEHLDGMEEHIEREEDVIFPYLKRQGWKGLCDAAQSDHVYIRIAVSDLIRLVTTFKKGHFKQFKVRLNSLAKYICPLIREHIMQEDNVLYPIALEVIQDEKVWQKIKETCDDLGYCGVHL